MAITEAARQHMIAALEAELGTEAAMSLIEHLPPSGWSHIDDRFDGIDRRLDGIDSRLAGIDSRLDGMDHQFAAVNIRFDAMESRFDGVDARFDGLESHILSQMDQRTAKLEQSFAAQSRSIVYAFVTSLIGFGGLMVAAVSIAH